METNLPQKISPEGLTVAEEYLFTNSIDQTARNLKMTPHDVSDYLNTREVKQYIDHVFLEAGYRNRNRLGELLDNIIDKKLEEMEEAEMGSGKDILEILQFAHKLRMDEIKAMQNVQNIKQQNNVVITDAGGSNYNQLLGKIYEHGK